MTPASALHAVGRPDWLTDHLYFRSLLGVSALGDGAAVAAMSGFVSGWSHGRTEIVTGVRSAHTLLVGAAGNYRQSDQNMAARLRPASAR
jgi:hypothetical protein